MTIHRLKKMRNASAPNPFARLLAAGSIVFALVLSHQNVHAQVPTTLIRDGTVGGAGDPIQTPNGDGSLFEVGENLGAVSGTNLFHSFSVFDVGAPDTVRFTALPGSNFSNVITRVTGGRSQIDGTIQSAIAGADFFFINPAGVVFGESARLDVPAAFYVSSADTLRFADGGEFVSTNAPNSMLSPVDPVAFGFFDANGGSIDFQGEFEVREGQRLAIVGGDIRVDGGQLSALDGEILLASVASPGDVVFGGPPGSSPFLSGVTQRGNIQIVNEAVVSSSGLSPLIRNLRDGNPESELVILQTETFPPGPFTVPPGSILLSDAILPNGRQQIQYYSINPNAPALARGAGRISVLAQDLLIEDSDLRADTVGPGTGEVDIDLSGDLTIQNVASMDDVGILARTGVQAEGFLQSFVPGAGCAGAAVGCTVLDASTGRVEFGPLLLDLTQNTGRGGDIRISANNVDLIDGGRIATSSLSQGAPGRISINARGAINLRGANPNPLPFPFAIAGSAIVTNHQGTPIAPQGPNDGRIEITAETLRLRNKSGLFAQTTGNGDAGDIEIDVNHLEVLDESQIDSSTSAQSLGPNDPGTTTGEGGSITVNAAQSVLLAGRTTERDFARLSTFSQARSGGGAGSIRVTTPLLEIRDGAGIAVTTEGEGSGGDIDLEVGTFRMRNGSAISASSESTLLPAGEVQISTADTLRIESGSRIEADTGIAAGGNITLDSGDAMLVGEDTAIQANAQTLGGSGGRVVINAPLVLRAASSVITADAPGGPEVQGVVEINSPVINVEDQLRAPAVNFLDASSLLLSRCAARRSGDRSGSFQIADWPGLEPAHDGPLLAYESIVPTLSLPAPTLEDDLKIQSFDKIATLIEGGELAFRAGRFDEAADRFSRAADLAGTDAEQKSDALRGAAQARQLSGNFGTAVAPLEQALELARSRGDASREAAALGQLGNVYLALGEFAQAEKTLEQSVAVARSADDVAALTLTLNHLGNLRSRQGKLDAARDHYEEAATKSRESGHSLRESQSIANVARIAIDSKKLSEALQLLDTARASTSDLESDSEVIALHVHLAESYLRIAREQPDSRRLTLPPGHRLLLEASAASAATGDDRLRSRVFGSLGALYAEEGGRESEALHLTQRALEAAERARAPMLMSRWSSQAARIDWTRGRIETAIVGYRRAVALVEGVHPEIRARYGGAELGFRQAVEPIYLDLVDALLQAPGERGEARQARLTEARETIERWKAAELRDYFQDECVAALESKARPLESISRNAAVIYPVLLADRVEILVGSHDGLATYTLPIGRDALTKTVRTLRRELSKRTTYEFMSPAKELYEALVAPYRSDLEAKGIDTLVFVPDRILRTIPLGALHDGSRFVVESFAVAVTPSLTITAPRSLDPGSAEILLAGVSQGVQGFSPLAHVPKEIEAIHERYGGTVLLDSQFEGDRFASELRERRPGIVHIASHAAFTGDPATSYILAHDRKLSIDGLSRLVESNRFGDEPIELLLLSACETASGDDRAALGLAGLAVRAGARSALGSLWRVDDEATFELITGFYERLGQSGLSKVEAFARAQRALLKKRRFGHPYYWASFMVINNWL